MRGKMLPPNISIGMAPAKRGQIELHRLRGSREVVDDQHGFPSERPRERQHAVIVGLQEFDRPAAEDRASNAAPR